MGSLSEYAGVLGPRKTAVWPVVAGIVPDGTVLMGGTALAIRLAHRRSEDLDLFTQHEFDPDPLHDSLDGLGNFVLSRKSLGHLHGTFDGVKVDILWNAGALTLTVVVNYFESRHPAIVRAFMQDPAPPPSPQL